ncbi:transposase [Streptomyces sp. NPDC055085]
MNTLILDLLDPEEARRPSMAMKDCLDEFKADAVALYKCIPGATYRSIAVDLGINRATLREWGLRDRECRGISATGAKPAVRHRAAGPLPPSGTSFTRRPSISPERRTGEEP